MSRRLRRVNVTPEMMLHFLLDGRPFKVTTPLPRDARVVSSGYDVDRNHFALIIQSEAFEDVPEAEIIPWMDIWIQAVPGVTGEVEGDTTTEERNEKV